MKPELSAAIVIAMADLSTLRFFPADEAAQLAIMRLLERMASEPAQVLWLGQIIMAHYREWPGPAVLRQEFCQEFVPADGVWEGKRDLQGMPIQSLRMRAEWAGKPTARGR